MVSNLKSQSITCFFTPNSAHLWPNVLLLKAILNVSKIVFWFIFGCYLIKFSNGIIAYATCLKVAHTHFCNYRLIKKNILKHIQHIFLSLQRGVAYKYVSYKTACIFQHHSINYSDSNSFSLFFFLFYFTLKVTHQTIFLHPKRNKDWKIWRNTSSWCPENESLGCIFSNYLKKMLWWDWLWACSQFRAADVTLTRRAPILWSNKDRI